MRRALEERYTRLFGCSPDRAPWDAAWRDVLLEALEADIAYERAHEVMSRLQEALSAAQELARSLPSRPGSDIGDACIGLTGPESALCAGFFHDDRPLANATDFVAWANSFQGLTPFDVVLSSPEGRHGMAFGAVAALAYPERVGPVLQRRLEAMYRRGTTRRLLAWDQDPTDGSPFPLRQYASVIGGVPPRAPGSTEWRRATLVALLDTWSVRDARSGRLRLLSDSEIAVVSLLAGGLEEIAQQPGGRKRIESGEVVRDERKAINHARKRRTVVTKFMSSEKTVPFRKVLEDTRDSLRALKNAATVKPPAGGEPSE